jgi:hypothetical protein
MATQVLTWPTIFRPAVVRVHDPGYAYSDSRVGDVSFPTFFRTWEAQSALEQIVQDEMIIHYGLGPEHNTDGMS